MKTNDHTTLREQVAAVTVYCFDIYLNGEHIERTFYNTKFPNIVKKDLVTKEGFDPKIKVVLYNPPSIWKGLTNKEKSKLLDSIKES